MKKLICLVVAIAYTLFPVDLSMLYGCPDVVPILGWIDDGAVDLILIFIAFRRQRMQLPNFGQAVVPVRRPANRITYLVR